MIDIEQESVEKQSDFAALKALSALSTVDTHYTFASTCERQDSDEIDITNEDNDGENAGETMANDNTDTGCKTDADGGDIGEDSPCFDRIA